jgi:hypothetical protein
MTEQVITNAVKIFKQYQRLGEKALERMTDEQLHWIPAPGSNSAAIIVKHLAGNMRSRFTDFLTTDGEKPDRNRDSEFEDDPAMSKEEILALWHSGWNILYKALEALTDADLQRIILIRGEEYTVLGAVQRQLAHYGSHIGQLIYISKLFAGENWESLSIPRGKSNEFNARMFDNAKKA